MAAQLEEAWAAKDVPASNKGLEPRLKKAEEDLNAVREERTHFKAMMQDVLWQARGSVEAAGLGSVMVASQGLDTLGHLALGFSEIARRLEALPAAVQELATREGHPLAQAVVVVAEEAAARAAVRDVATEVAEFFVREPGLGSDSGDDT